MEITLLLVEPLARLAVDGIETVAAIGEHLLQCFLLRGIELEFRGQAIQDLAGVCDKAVTPRFRGKKAGGRPPEPRTALAFALARFGGTLILTGM